MQLHPALMIALTAALAATPVRAFACGASPNPCAAIVVAGLEDPIPANTPQIPLTGRVGLSDTDLTLFEGSGADERAVQGFHLQRSGSWPEALVFDRELTPGTSYRLVVAGCLAPQEFTILVGPSAPFPSSLGALEVSLERRTQRLFNSSPIRCADVDFDALVAKLSIAWSDDAQPWRNLLEWQIVVDGARANYPTAKGRELLVVCGGEFFPLLSEGEHSVSVRATLPGRDDSLQTVSVETSLHCDAPGPSGSAVDTSPPSAAATAATNTPSPELSAEEPSSEQGCRLGAGRPGDVLIYLALISGCLWFRRAGRRA